MRYIDKIIVHCSDTPNNKDITVEEIRSWHVNDNGWSDIGYHFVIYRNGDVMTGRSVSIAGAHCYGQNAHSIGICFIGRDEFNKEQFKAFRNLYKVLVNVFGELSVHGHRDFTNQKTCPNFEAREILINSKGVEFDRFEKEIIMYEEVRNKMKTGDVIAFSGKGRTSNIIKWGTKSDISHVGIVYRTEEDRVIIMESTSLNNIADCATGEFIKGVQQQYLSDRIKSYDGQAYWYALNKPIEDDYAMCSWLKDRHGKKVPYDTLQALGSALDVLMPDNEEDFKKLFCSELVCKALQLAGIVPEELNASEQTPADVIQYDCLEERVQIG